MQSSPLPYRGLMCVSFCCLYIIVLEHHTVQNVGLWPAKGPLKVKIPFCVEIGYLLKCVFSRHKLPICEFYRHVILI